MSMRTVMIKPAGSFCNLNCAYCFYLDKRNLYEGAPSTHRMPDEVLDKLITDMFACSESPVFVWHGGEPTLMGLNFFMKAVMLQRWASGGKPYSNAIQTNGMLLDENWTDFLRDEGFLVGISLDGPAHVHDRYRRDRSGRKTFANVFENALMARNKGVQVNILAAVNDYSVNHASEIYRFFVKNGFDFMQFNPVVEEDPEHPGCAAPFSVNASDYGRFLDELFRLWTRDFDREHMRQKTSIRFFDALIRKYAGMIPDHCIFHRHCANYLVVEHNGDLYSCDYLVDNDTRVGNIKDMSLAEAFEHPAHEAFRRRKAELDNTCECCRWLDLCRGGCIKDRIRDSNDLGRNRFCSSYRFFFDRADSRLREFAQLYRRNYPMH